MGWPKGRKQTEEHKNKKSESSKGRIVSPETAKKISVALLQRNVEKGRHSWKYEEWRRQVLERDGHKCVMCGSSGPKLHCHHIIPWKKSKKLRFCVENGQTLCASCHVKEGLKNKELSEKGRFKKGQKFSEEHCKKISEALKGKETWNKGKTWKCPWNKGRIPWNKGKPMSDETRKKVSEARKGKVAWNKGIPCSEEMKKRISETKLNAKRYL